MSRQTFIQKHILDDTVDEIELILLTIFALLSMNIALRCLAINSAAINYIQFFAV